MARIARVGWYGVVALQALSAHAAVFSVGAGGDCDFATLGPAIAATAANGGAADVIHVTAGSFASEPLPLTIDAQTLEIIGGYATCSDSEPGGTTQINGATSVLNVQATSPGTTQLTIRRIAMMAGNGRVIDINGASAVSLFDTEVTGGSEQNGGGIRVRGAAASLVLGAGTNVHNNHGQQAGGGVYCDNGAELTMDYHSAIQNNTTANYGGGVYLDACAFVDNSGGIPADLSGTWGILNNTASVSGGGVYVFDATMSGAGTREANRIAGNDAPSGGGIFVTGSQAIVELVNTAFEDNSSSGTGGGVRVTQAARFAIGRNTPTCPGDDFCSWFRHNGAGYGGAIYVGEGGQAVLKQLLFDHNVAGAGHGIVETHGSDSLTLIEGAVLVGNSVAFSVTDDNATLRAAYLSSNGNNGLFSVGANGHVSFYSSVLQDNVFIAPIGSGAALFADCAIVKEASSFPSGLDGIEVMDAPDVLFKNPALDDLRLSPQSRAIDRCDTFAYSPTTLDVFGFPRGFDVPSLHNTPAFGPIDMGAIEAPWIFAGDFDR